MGPSTQRVDEQDQVGHLHDRGKQWWFQFKLPGFPLVGGCAGGGCSGAFKVLRSPRGRITFWVSKWGGRARDQIKWSWLRQISPN